MTDHGTTSGVFKSLFLCVVIGVRTIPFVRTETLDKIIRSVEDSVNGILGLTCRSRALSQYSALLRADLVHCDDIKSLEQECKDFGNERRHRAQKNDQPRPVKTSKHSW